MISWMKMFSSNNAMLSSLEVHMFVTDWNSGTVIFLMIKSTHGISNNIIYQFLQIENQMCWTHRARDVVYRCCPRYQSPRKTAPVDQWQSTPLATWTSGWRIGGMCFRWLKWSSKALDMEILSKDVLGYTLAGQKLCLLSRPTAKPFPPRILLSTWFWSISTPEKLFSLLNLKRGDNWPCHTWHAKWTW